MAIHDSGSRAPEPYYPVPNQQLDYIQQWLGQNPPQGRLDPVANTLFDLGNNATFLELVDLINIGDGDPNGVVTASPPAFYLNRTGGVSTTLYVKESGTDTNTGWVGK